MAPKWPVCNGMLRLKVPARYPDVRHFVLLQRTAFRTSEEDRSKYPPAKPEALDCEPLKAAKGPLARPINYGPRTSFLADAIIAPSPLPIMMPEAPASSQIAAPALSGICAFDSTERRVDEQLKFPIHLRFTITDLCTLIFVYDKLLLPPRQSLILSHIFSWTRGGFFANLFSCWLRAVTFPKTRLREFVRG